jgi:hypothetical protein
MVPPRPEETEVAIYPPFCRVFATFSSSVISLYLSVPAAAFYSLRGSAHKLVWYISGRFSSEYRATIGAGFITKTLPNPTRAEGKGVTGTWQVKNTSPPSPLPFSAAPMPSSSCSTPHPLPPSRRCRSWRIGGGGSRDAYRKRRVWRLLM